MNFGLLRTIGAHEYFLFIIISSSDKPRYCTRKMFHGPSSVVSDEQYIIRLLKERYPTAKERYERYI